jgi:hypothetical protein
MIRGSSKGWTKARPGGHRRGVQGVARQQNLGAELAGLLDLGERRELRHDDGRRNAQALGVIGDALGMVAGGHGDHAPLGLLVAEALELDQGAAVLEGARVLEALESLR